MLSQQPSSLSGKLSAAETISICHFWTSEIRQKKASTAPRHSDSSTDEQERHYQRQPSFYNPRLQTICVKRRLERKTSKGNTTKDLLPWNRRSPSTKERRHRSRTSTTNRQSIKMVQSKGSKES